MTAEIIRLHPSKGDQVPPVGELVIACGIYKDAAGSFKATWQGRGDAKDQVNGLALLAETIDRDQALIRAALPIALRIKPVWLAKIFQLLVFQFLVIRPLKKQMK